MAWLTGWTYRKAIVIAHSDDGEQADYQIKLLVGESSGASGEQVDCAAHVLSSFNDLRFTTSDGETPCPYWIESITGSTPNQLATVWVKVSVAVDDTTIYMYYGKADASSESSGADTFIAFDDFERGSDGDMVGGSWGTVTNVEIDTGIFWPGAGSTRSGRWAGGTSQARINRAASSSIAIQMRMIKTDVASPIVWHGDAGSRMYSFFTGTENWIYYDGSYHTVEALSHSTWYLFEYRNFNYDANTYDMVRDGVVKQVAAAQEASAAANGIIWIYNSAASGDINIDNLIVRKWTANEPAFGSAGAEVYQQVKSLTGSLGLSGILMSITAFRTKVLAGTLNMAGSLNRKTMKSLSGVVDFAGTMTSVLTMFKSLTGTINSSGTLGVKVKKALTGALTSSGTINRKAYVALSGTISLSGTVGRKTKKTLTGILSSSGYIITKTSKSMSGALNASGTIGIKTKKGFVGTLTSSGTLGRKIYKGLTGILGLSGVLGSVLTTFKSLTGILSSSGSLNLKVKEALSGTLTSSGVLSRKMLVKLSGAVSLTGGLSIKVKIGLTGSISFVGALGVKVKKILTGVLNLVGTLSSKYTSREEISLLLSESSGDLDILLSEEGTGY